tara:strand:- start:4682 stop:5044 length:363 start_codon:yes stop_codon:yes gene_type:complete
MNSHIIVSILFCTLSCEPAEIRVWDGDSIRLGLTREVALRFIHLADDWIADCRGRSRVCHTVSMRGLRLNLHQIRQVCRFSGRLKADVGRALPSGNSRRKEVASSIGLANCAEARSQKSS